MYIDLSTPERGAPLLQAGPDVVQGQINLALVPQPSTQEENEDPNNSCLVGSFPLPNVGASVYVKERKVCLVFISCRHYYYHFFVGIEGSE